MYESGKPMSTQKMADELGTSRSTVWKVLSAEAVRYKVEKIWNEKKTQFKWVLTEIGKSEYISYLSR